MAPSTCSLCHSSGRTLSRSQPLDTAPLSFLSAGESPEPSISRQVLRRLKRLHRRGQLRCTGPASTLADTKQFHRLLRRLHRQDWVVYAKPAFGGPTKVLRFLGRYTHRIAISNHRLQAFDGEHVTFRWKDYAHGGKQRKMTLLATEFLRRFFLHVLPKGFVRIRYFGFVAKVLQSTGLRPCSVRTVCTPSPKSTYLMLFSVVFSGLEA